MQALGWLLLAWGAGAMFILGGLMLLGSLLLLLERPSKTDPSPGRLSMLKLLLVSATLFSAGGAALIAFPFPA